MQGVNKLSSYSQQQNVFFFKKKKITPIATDKHSKTHPLTDNYVVKSGENHNFIMNKQRSKTSQLI